jgi:CelD/BcsL family acetyltransferase involved in cellulose biosynthesis
VTGVTADTAVETSVLDDFEHGVPDRGSWDRLVAGSCDVIFMTHDWQREWWRAFSTERERLLLVVAERAGAPVAIAPLFATKEMLCLVGSDGSDYLDFIGQLDEATLAAMLESARAQLPDFAGVALYHVPHRSPTTALLAGVAERLGLQLHSEGEMSAPFADLTDSERVRHLTARRTLRKAQARMRRTGDPRVRTAGESDIDGWLELFFAQHDAIWSARGQPGLRSPEARAFLRAIVRAGTKRGWLRFSMLEWEGRAAAFEITLILGERHLSYVGSRDDSIDYYSPGAVLGAHLVAEAVAEGTRVYDFGVGEEEYKLHDASGATRVVNWFMWPVSTGVHARRR